jgi:hypothetical protein
VPYDWCNKNCPGWSASKTSKLNQWVGPFVGFIVPAVIFCLAIPRRRKIHVPDWLFGPAINRVTSLYKVPFLAIGAAMLVALDTIVWLLICFALAGPMLLSGLYEAFLDNRILAYLYEKYRNNRLTVDMRARLLYLVLVGNLDPPPPGEYVPLQPNQPPDTAWDDIEGLTENIRIYPIPRQHPLNGEDPFDIFQNRRDDIRATKTRLRTMLACQYS